MCGCGRGCGVCECVCSFLFSFLFLLCFLLLLCLEIQKVQKGQKFFSTVPKLLAGHCFYFSFSVFEKNLKLETRNWKLETGY